VVNVTYDCADILNGTTLSVADDMRESLGTAYEGVRVDCMLKAIMPPWLNELQTCKEDFPKNGRMAYSSVTMAIQYLLPTITITFAYFQIFGQLRVRLVLGIICGTYCLINRQ
jgi:hypothetical protein